MDKKKGLIYVTLFSLAWAIQTIINKIAVNRGIEPLSFSYQTVFGAAVILFLYIILVRAKDFKEVKIKSLPSLIAVGVLGSGVATILTFYGLKYSTSINYGFLIKSTIIFSILLAFVFLKEKITIKKVALMIVLLLGAYLISTKGQTIYPKAGDLIILAAAFFLSTANVMAKPLLKKYSAELVTFFRTFFGALVILIFVPFIVPKFYLIQDIPLFILRSIFVFLSLFFLNKAIKATNVSYLTMMSMMYSVFVVILGYFILNETLSLIQAIGGVLIIVSVILIQRSRKLSG